MHPTPFVATTPLDILAGVFFAMSILSLGLGICTIVAVTCSVMNIDLYFDYKGYDLMIINSRVLPRGYGVNFFDRFEIWRYIEKGAEGKIECKLFPA